MAFFGLPPFPPAGPRFGERWRRAFGIGPHAGEDEARDGRDEEDDDEADGPDEGRYSGGRGGPWMELHRRSFQKRIETGPEARFRIDNRNGHINVHVHDQPAIVIDVVADLYADSSKEADAEAARLERGIVSEGQKVDVRTPEFARPEWSFFGRGSRVNYDIFVPAETEVFAACRNGPVHVSWIRRNAYVEGRNGRITVEDVGGDVKVDSRNGRVNIRRCGGSASVTGRNGPVWLENVRGAIVAESTNGPIEVTEPGAGVSASSRNGGVRYSGRVNGDVELQATNGSLRMAVPAESRFEIDAESRHGSVQSDLQVNEARPAEGAGPAPKVRLRTTNGSIRISRL